MSSMLEQAIADAAALREQAIKNAEQSVLDKYSKQIKEAVDQMLEMEQPTDLDRANETIKEVENELVTEEDMGLGGDSSTDDATVTAPIAAYDSRPEANDLMTRVHALIANIDTDSDGNINLDLGDISAEEMNAADGAPEQDLDASSGLDSPNTDNPAESDVDDILGDLGGDDIDLQLQEVLDMLKEETVEEKIEEDLGYDYDPYKPTGTPGVTDVPSKMNQEAALALDAIEEDSEEESEEESEDSTGITNQLQETVEFLTQQNSKMENVLSKMEVYL